MKWVPIILGALLLLGAGGFFGIRFLKNRKFEATLAEATKFRDAGKYKNALETCAIAQEMAGDLPEVKSLRFDILARARMQHEAVIAQVRAHFATAMPDSFALACQLLNYGAENASILKRGDSTAFYKALVCDLAPETPSETSEPPAPVPSEESKPKKEPKPTSEPKPTTEPQPKPTITQAEITARQQRAAQAQQKEDENQRKKEEAKQAKLDAAARKKAQQAAEEEAREVAKIKKEQEDEAARKKAEAERIKPAPAAATFKRDGNLLGVASSAYSGSEASCKALMGGQASVTLSPKETVRLERAYLAVNKCGTVRMKLVGPSGTMREVVTEVAGRGLAEMDFAGDFGAVKLEKGQQYTLSFSPAESEACAGKPQIESLSPSCGADSRDNSPQLAIKQNGGAFLFDLKYKY